MDYAANTASLYEQYVTELQRIADIRYSTAVLQWDQETYMPPAGAGFRAQQIATLSELAHLRFTHPDFVNLVHELSGRSDLNDEGRKNISLSKYDVEQQVKLPSAFVRRLSETVSRAFNAWMDARRKNDFGVFLPLLGDLVELKKQEADMLGYEGHPYNALLNEFERGSTVDLLDKTFSQLQGPLRNLLDRISKCSQVDDTLLHQHFPEHDQWQFSMQLLEKMNYDFHAGRQDKAEHPFTTNFSSRDVRITTRIDEQDLSNMTYSTIHELGHALYEQGLPTDQYGLPLGEYASLSIHESQSRLWENNVGRSLPWCQNFFPVMKHYFPKQFTGHSADQFYRAVNKVTPSLIRTEADELTYHFHVIIRYELEKSLIGGLIKVEDIPAFWNENYRKYLGVTVPDDRKGCLQDVHWSHGSFGYFPTYSLGSLYAAQFFESVRKAVDRLDDKTANGDFSELLVWLRQNIHIHGRRFNSEELCINVTGEGINIRHFMQYAEEKYRFIYAFQTEGIAI